MKDKKGFTITEVLATLVILGIVIAIAVPSVSKLQEKFRKEYYDKLEGTIVAAAKTYYKDNPDKRPVNILEASIIQYNNLSKYVDSGIEGYNNERIGGKVVVVKTVDGYIYKNCSKINDIKQYSDVSDGNNDDNICYFEESDNITSDYGSSSDLYIHVNNYTQDELRDKLGLHKTITRSNSSGKQLYSVTIDNDVIYPQNITAISSNKEGTYTLTYSSSITKEVHVFQHPAPLINDSENTTIEVSKSEEYKLSMPASKDTFGSLYNSGFVNYQYSVNGGSWTNLSCSNKKTCESNPQYFIGKKVKFRVVGKDKQTKKNQYGKATNEVIFKYKKIRIDLDANGGTVSPNSLGKFSIGDKYPSLPTPTRSGYEFVKWVLKTDYSKTIKQNDSITIDSDHTLLAIWKNAPYKINYNANGGKGSMAVTECYAGASCNLRSNAFTRDGYTFKGWSKTSGGSVSFNDKASVNFGEDVTLYAVWKANDYEVTFDPNGGTLNGQLTKIRVTYGSRYLDNYDGDSFPEPTYLGYKFLGWYTAKTGGNKIYATTRVSTSKNHVLYAHWEKHKINIQVNMNGGTLSSKKFGYASSGGYITHLLSKNVVTTDYGSTVTLPNYNSGNFTITKGALIAKSGAEWKLNNTSKTFGNGAKVNSSNLCDATYEDCTATLYVNWQDPPTLSIVTTDAVTKNSYYSEISSGTTVYVQNMTYQALYFNAFIKSNGYSITNFKYKVNDGSLQDFGVTENCADKKYRICSNANSNDYIRKWTNFKNVGQYKITVTANYNKTGTLSATYNVTIADKPSINLEVFATDATLSGGKYTEYNSNWTNKDIYLNAFVTSNDNQIKELKYSLDNKNWNNFPNKNISCDQKYKTCSSKINRRDFVLFNSTMNKKVYVKVVDGSGRQVIKEVPIKIDKSKPTKPKINVTGKITDTRYFNIVHGTDNDSGISKSQYSFNKSSWTDYKSSVTLLTTTGVKKVYARTIDRVGNISDITEVTGQCNKDGITVSRVSNSKENGWCYFTLEFTPKYSGLNGTAGYDYYYWNPTSTNDTENTDGHGPNCDVNNLTNLKASGKGTTKRQIRFTQYYSKQYYCLAVRPHRNSEINGLNRWTIQKKHAITGNSCRSS